MADTDFLAKLTSVVDKRLCESNLSSETLAVDFCLSPRHFNRRVNAVTGMNTTHFIRLRRIELACTLLSTTDLPICEIFMNCGIESANYFSRIFKMEMGMTPSEYRMELQK